MVCTTPSRTLAADTSLVGVKLETPAAYPQQAVLNRLTPCVGESHWLGTSMESHRAHILPIRLGLTREGSKEKGTRRCLFKPRYLVMGWW